MESYLELAKADIQRLQAKLNEAQQENGLLRAQLGQKSSDFCSRIVRFVESLHLREQMSDVRLLTPQKSYPGHKFVLEARGGNWKPNNKGDQDEIIIEGAEQAVCEGLILWLYTGKLMHVNEHRYLSQLMLIANKFSVSELICQCEENLVPLLDRKNCIELYSAAHTSKANRLLEHCFTFLSTVWSSVSKEELGVLTAPVLRSILEKQTRFPLHLAIKIGRADVAVCLMDSNPIEVRLLVNELDADGLSPLYLALEDGLFDLAEQLLRAGADANLLLGNSEEKQPTALFAFEKRRLKAVRFLIEHGMQLSACSTPDGYTLLHLLAKTGPNSEDEKERLEIARLLLKRHADVNAKDTLGNTPLHVSILHNSKSVFDLLLEYINRIDWGANSRSTASPLWLALLADYARDRTDLLKSNAFDLKAFADTTKTSFAETLVQAGAPVNAELVPPVRETSKDRVRLGETLLMACAHLGLESAALFLLNQQVSPVDTLSSLDNGETVFHLAVESQLKQLCHCLIREHDVDPNQFRVVQITCEPKASLASVSPAVTQPNKSKPVTSQNAVIDPFSLFPDDDDELQKSCANFGHTSPQLIQRMDPDGQGQPSTDDTDTNLPVREVRCERHTPLHLAMFHELYEVIELYLEHKARRDANWFLLDHNGESVFSLSLWNGQLDLAHRILIAASKACYEQKSQSNTNRTASLMNDPADVLARFGAHTEQPSLLQRAVIRGQLNAVHFLIRHGVDVNDSMGSMKPETAVRAELNRFVCPLLTALMNNKQSIADLLVTSGADINNWKPIVGTPVQVTLLHRAILERDETTAEYLIRSNCDVNAVPKYPTAHADCSIPTELACLQPQLAWSPIHMAANLGLLRIVQSLVNSTRTDVSRQDANGDTALHIAVRSGHYEIVDVLLHSPVFDCTVKNTQGHTAFYVSMDTRNVKAAQAILERDPTLALQTDKSGRNFLHLAVQNVDRAAIFFLIQTGMGMNQRVDDADQYTPLHLAIIAGVPEDIFRSLLLAGASMDDRTPRKYTPMHLCVLHNRAELLHCLIESGASVNEQDSEMNTPLHLAIRTGHIACLTVLLAQEATDVCIMNVRGQLPIHLLSEHDPSAAVEMLQYLFEVCVAPQINAKDASGNTPLILAYRASNIALCIALVHAGASLGVANTDGHSVFSLSRQRTRSAAPDRILSQILDSLMQEPKWEDGLVCVECNNKFGLTNRKHHCRHCGRLLCANCSNFELPIIKFGINKPVRVCETCYQFLNNPLGI